MEIMLLFALAIYMIPTIISVVNKNRNAPSVAVVNVLLGWTLVGWVVALCMAMWNQGSDRR